MLSEIAINDKEAFKKLVKIALDGKEGKIVKPEPIVKKTTVAKKEVVKEEKADLSKLTVAELKEIAKEKGIELASGAKKADILAALK